LISLLHRMQMHNVVTFLGHNVGARAPSCIIYTTMHNCRKVYYNPLHQEFMINISNNTTRAQRLLRWDTVWPQ